MLLWSIKHPKHFPLNEKIQSCTPFSVSDANATFQEDILRAHCYSDCQNHTVHPFQMRAEESGVVRARTYPLYGVFGLFKLLRAKSELRVCLMNFGSVYDSSV